VIQLSSRAGASGLLLGVVGNLLVFPACSDDDATAGQNNDSSSSSESTAGDGDSAETEAGTDDGTDETGADPWQPTEPFERDLIVTLDGEPVEGAVVSQGGVQTRWLTDENGEVKVTVDPSIVGGAMMLHAAVEEARIVGVNVVEDPAPLEVELVSFDASDNLDYVFQDPGTPENRGNTSKCAHCHQTITADWAESPHRYSAQNEVVQDVYAGSAAAFADQVSCEAVGGQWWSGVDPASGDPTQRCYLGQGTLPDLNADCGDTDSCDGVATEFGDCADCHAPAIDGILGGRDLLEAGGIPEDITAEGNRAYEYGVHCDLCHKISDIHLDEKPGVGGRLDIIRSSEEQAGALGPWKPLTFGPYDDVAHVRMGASPRTFFKEATICAGCHELSEPPRLPGATLDADRWPDGVLPMHTTYSEWQAGVLGGVTPCQACHMPPDPSVLNSADLMNTMAAGPGAGWVREPGSVRRHVWGGPRTAEAGLLENAAALFVEHQQNAGELEVAVTVRNAGAGHQIPTGEAMRSLILLVEADCAGQALEASGGDSVPEFGGAVQTKVSGDDWGQWPGAEVGQVIRVVSLAGGFHDYEGYGPFGDGSFSAADKGMPVQEFAGQSTVVAVNGVAVTLDAPLPTGDIAYLGDPLPTTDGELPRLAGSPGFAFARVLTDPGGELMVPHYRAVDVISDNRLAPQQEWTSLHRFDLGGGCVEPQVRARLVYRPLPPNLARERDWSRGDITMAEVVK
jgi:hypothetical protein